MIKTWGIALRSEPLDGEKVVENTSQANTGHCEQFLYDPLARDLPSVLGCIQLQVRVRWLSAKQIEPGQRRTTIGRLIHLLGPDPLAGHLMNGGRPMIRTHSLVVGVAGTPSPANDELLRLLPQREWFWVLLARAPEPRVNFVLPPSADTIDHDLPNQGIIDSSSEMLLNLMIRNRSRVVVRGGPDGFGDDKSVPHGMEIYSRVGYIQHSIHWLMNTTHS